MNQPINTQPCTKCKGTGRLGRVKQRRCDVCRGKGYVRKLSNTPRNIARRDAARKANLLDPEYGREPRFPLFYSGMTTAAYVRYFQRLNSSDPRHLQTDVTVGPLTFHCDNYYRNAPMLDPLAPEVVEGVLP